MSEQSSRPAGRLFYLESQPMEFQTARKALEFLAEYKTTGGDFTKSMDDRGIIRWDDAAVAVIDVEKILDRFPRGAQRILIAYALDGFQPAVDEARRFARHDDPIESVKDLIRDFKQALRAAGYMRPLKHTEHKAAAQLAA